MKRFKVILPLVLALMVSLTAFAGASSYTFSSNDGGGVASDLNDLDHSYLYVWAIDPTQMMTEIKAKNERIVSASISFKNIYNWAQETDVLKVYLVDNPRVADNPIGTDIWSAADGQSTSGSMKELTDPLFTSATIQKWNSTKRIYETVANPNYRFTAITKLWQWTDVQDLKHNPDPVTGRANSYGHDLLYTFDQPDQNAPLGSTNELPTLLDYMNSLNPNRTALNNYATFGFGFDPDCHYYNDGIQFIVTTEPIPAPEPSTFVLLGAGLLGAGLYRRRRSK